MVGRRKLDAAHELEGGLALRDVLLAKVSGSLRALVLGTFDADVLQADVVVRLRILRILMIVRRRDGSAFQFLGQGGLNSVEG
jgi:hypothetical protein